MIGFLIGEDAAFQSVDQAAFCNAVAVIVHQHIFNAQIARGEAVILGIDVVVFVGVAAIRAGQAVFFGVAFAEYVLRCAQITRVYLEPHLLEFGQRDRHHTRHIGAVVQERRSPSTLDDELLRRERLDVHLLLFHLLRHLGVEQRNHRAHDRRSRLNLVSLLLQHRQYFSRSALHFLHIPHCLRYGAPHHGAVLRNQRIFECRVQREKAVVLLVEHVVARIRGLGCALHILGGHRLKRNGLIGGREHVEQLGQDPLHGVLHLRGDDLRPAVQLFIAWVWLSVILAHRGQPLLTHLSDILRSIILIGLQVFQQRVVGHLCHHSSLCWGLRPRFAGSGSGGFLPWASSSGESSGNGGLPTRCDPSG